MGFNFGAAFGAAMTSGVKTYGDLLTLKERKQDLDARDAERAAMQQSANGTTTDVTPATLATQYQGADGKADPDAVMQTYGAMQGGADPAASMNQGAQMANAANPQGAPVNLAANPTTAPVGIAAQPPTSPDLAQGAPTQQDATGSGGSNMGAVLHDVLGREGGYVANDNGKGPTNFGINGQANGLTPDQVKNLTPDAAAQIYKDKYLGPKGVNVDSMDPASAQIVGDTAVNQGPGRAEQWYQQSGGDMNKFLQLRQAAYTQLEKTQPQNAPTWQSRMQDMAHYINKQGTPEQHNEGDTPVAPSAKLTPLTIESTHGVTGIPVSQATGAPGAAQFTRDNDGNVSMQTPMSAADRLQAVANAAYKAGDVKNYAQLQQVALTARSQEGAQQVQSIMASDKLTGDQKVAQLTHLAGVQAYKTPNGSYLVPGMGPTDAKGNPVPMSLGQVAATATFMTTPEGMHYLVDAQQKQQQMGIDQQKADADTTKAGAEATEATSRGKLYDQQGKYYGASADASIGQKNAQADAAGAQADERRERAAIASQMQGIQDKMSALDPKDPDYATKRQNLMDQHSMLVQRGGGTVQKPPAPVKVTDGQTITDPDGSNPRTFLQAVGGYVPAQKATSMMAGSADLAAHPEAYQIGGTDVVRPIALPGGADAGFMLDPAKARQFGLNPQQLYPTPAQAMNALKQKLNAARGPMPPGVADTTPAQGAEVTQQDGGAQRGIGMGI
jgi:hypothetical protein